MIDNGGENLPTHEHSRKTRFYLDNSHPCKECLSYAICQNEDIVVAIKECDRLAWSVFRRGGEIHTPKLYLQLSMTEGHQMQYYVSYDGVYMGNFWIHGGMRNGYPM